MNEHYCSLAPKPRRLEQEANIPRKSRARHCRQSCASCRMYQRHWHVTLGKRKGLCSFTMTT